MSKSSFDRKHFALLLWGIAAFALALRLLAVWELAGTPFVQTPPAATDMATYLSLGRAVRQGIFPAVFDYQPFYYTLFLPAAWLFSPEAPVGPVLFYQSIIGALTVLLAGLSAAQLFGRRAGLLAAALLALSRYHIFYSAFLLLEVWFAFWAMLVLFLTLRTLKPNARWFWAPAAGLACGFALLTRGSALLWVPAVLGLLLWRNWRQWRRLFAQAAFFGIAFLLPLLPFAIHNSRATGRLCGPSVAGGKVLVLGNSPEAPAGGLEYPRTYYQWCQEAETGKCSVLKNVLSWAAQEPAAFIELELRKLVLFWDQTEIPNNVSFVPHADPSRVLHLPLLLPWALFAIPACAGLLILPRRKNKARMALTGLTLVVWGATSAFYILARFRIVAIPLLCVLAAGFITEFIRRAGRLKQARNLPAAKQQLLRAAFALLIGVYFVCIAHSLYSSSFEARTFNAVRPDGFARHFDQESVIYDHGPLFFGDSRAIAIPPEGLTITKLFTLPEGFRNELLQRSSNGRLRQRLMLRLAAPQADTGDVRLSFQGQRIYAAPSLVNDRSAQWLAFEFDAELPPAGTPAEFVIDLAPNAKARHTSIVLDFSRNYRRTKLRLAGQPTQLLPAEAAAEWCFPR